MALINNLQSGFSHSGGSTTKNNEDPTLLSNVFSHASGTFGNPVVDPNMKGASPNVKNVYSSGTGGDGGTRYSGSSSAASTGSDYNLGYLDYLSAAMAARAQAIANANAALDKQGSAIEQRYKNQMNEVGQDYQKLKNQSELNRYKSLRSLRETQANRGLLNSGAGRQENLNVNATYGNALNEIGMQEQNELNRIQQAINEMWAQIATQKAQNEASISGDFTSGLISALSNPLYQYGGVSDDAKALAATQLNQNPAVANGMFQGLSSAQLQALFQQDNQANLLRNLGSVYSNINY